MSTESQHSLRIEIPKPRKYSTFSNKKRTIIIKKNIIKNTTKVSEASLPKCTLPKIQSFRQDYFQRAEILLPYKFYLNEQNSKKHLLNMSTSINDRYKIRSNDLKGRRHVQNPPNYVHSITDIDKDYFTSTKYINHYKYALHYKSFKSVLNDQLRLKHEISLRKDNVLNVEVKYRSEVKMYELALNRYENELIKFDNFIAENYHKSMVCLSLCDELGKKVNQKESELNNLAIQNFTMMSTLLNQDYMYGLQLKYGRFLYYLSPPTWRLENRQFARSIDIEVKGFEFGLSSADDNFDIVYEKISNNCINNYTSPVLYFQEPSELLKVFDNIKKRQLHIFNYIFKLQPFIKILQDRVIELKQAVVSDTESVASIIEEFNSLLLFNEERCSQLEIEFFKILNNSFYNDVAALDVLKFCTSLEFCYEKVYSEKPLNLDLITVARGLESMYLDYCSRLDLIQAVEIRKAIVKLEEAEKRKLQKAYQASQELQIFNRLQKHLTRAFEPTYDSKIISLPPIGPRKEYKNGRSVKIRSVAEINRRSLTDAEHEYLCLFTDWGESEDPALYLKCLRLSQD